MQWWDAVGDWIASDDGRLVLLGAVVPFVAIVIAGVVAAFIARGAIVRLIRSRDRESKTVVLAALVDAARQASIWDASSPAERTLADRAAAEVDLRLRLLPLNGSATAADWAAHQLSELRRASATFTLQLEEPLIRFRDRLVDWDRRPRRATRGFESDLALWKAERAADERRLQVQRDEWTAQQQRERDAATAPETASGQSSRTVSLPANTD